MASSSQGAAPPTTPPPPSPDSAQRSSLSIIAFETGNPEAGALTRGSLTLAPGWDACDTVVVEGVPGIMTSADFCAFLRPHMDVVQHIRLLRPVSERNRYMVAARLRAGRSASALADALSGRAYLHGLVAETCRVRAVSSATLRGGDALFSGVGADASCAVCLERLDGTPCPALVTTLCNHTLHAGCLAQCELNRCPVCRHAHELTPEASVCMTCADADDVWMCVVCAYVGCGVYKNKHAYEHFRDTHHPFAMNLNELVFWSGERVPASSVWDYISERFVDRLLAADDGKVVELGGGPGGASASATAGAPHARKMCAAPDARPHLGDAQDEALAAAVAESRLDHLLYEQRSEVEHLRAEHAAAIESLRERADSAEEEASTARKMRADAIRERKAASKRADAAEREMAKLRDKNEFLKNVNENLLKDQEGWKKRVDAISEVARSAREERDSLKEQLRDLMMHLQTQATISAAQSGAQSTEQCRGAGAAAELAGADVLRVGPSARERLALKLNRRASNR